MLSEILVADLLHIKCDTKWFWYKHMAWPYIMGCHPT